MHRRPVLQAEHLLLVRAIVHRKAPYVRGRGELIKAVVVETVCVRARLGSDHDLGSQPCGEQCGCVEHRLFVGPHVNSGALVCVGWLRNPPPPSRCMRKYEYVACAFLNWLPPGTLWWRVGCLPLFSFGGR